MSGLHIEPLGDGALLIELGTRIDTAVNAHALALADALRAAALPGVTDIAPAYASVCVRYDPAAWHAAAMPFEAIAARIDALARAVPARAPAAAHAAGVEIPVCYDAEFGPDIGAVAQHTGLSAAAVVARHCAGDYRVAMLGFAPGFAYLLGLDAALIAPRRASPRTRVPAGSVAIGGAQTGIYPSELPGGWHIIGRTPLRLFDAARTPAALLAPGQGVRFRAIDRTEFERRR